MTRLFFSQMYLKWKRRTPFQEGGGGASRWKRETLLPCCWLKVLALGEKEQGRKMGVKLGLSPGK